MYHRYRSTAISKSAHLYIFGDGEPSPSIGMTDIVFGDHEFSMDIVLRDIPGLIGMDILGSKDRGRSILKLDISKSQLTVDVLRTQSLWPSNSHLKLPDKLITITPNYRQTKTSHRSGQNNTVSYYQDSLPG